MSQVVRHRWSSDLAAPSREARRSCEYEAYVPDPLVGRPITLDGEVAADVTEAETAIATFDSQGTSLADTEALARILLRAEAVASSRIEGLEVGARRLLRAEEPTTRRGPSSDVTARRSWQHRRHGSCRPQHRGPESDHPPSPPGLPPTAAHRDPTGRPRGILPSEQNWIGGSDYNPCSAAFVPPPPETSGRSWRTFAPSPTMTLPAVAQAAMAHAQLKPSIHSLTATDAPGAP